MVYSSDREEALTRILLETPSGRHVVLTKNLSGPAGLDRVRLLDERTGWWVEVYKQYPLTGESLRAFLHEAMDLVEQDDVEPLRVTLVTSEGFEAEADLPANTQPWVVHENFVTELERSGLMAELRAEVPADFGREIDFLEAALVEEGFDLRAPVEILDGVLPEAPDSGAMPAWRLERSKIGKGVTLVTPELLEFTAGFRSVENSEPLVDVFR
jgi:hypothetical protein